MLMIMHTKFIMSVMDLGFVHNEGNFISPYLFQQGLGVTATAWIKGSCCTCSNKTLHLSTWLRSGWPRTFTMSFPPLLIWISWITMPGMTLNRRWSSIFTIPRTRWKLIMGMMTNMNTNHLIQAGSPSRDFIEAIFKTESNFIK